MEIARGNAERERETVVQKDVELLVKEENISRVLLSIHTFIQTDVYINASARSSLHIDICISKTSPFHLHFAQYQFSELRK